MANDNSSPPSGSPPSAPMPSPPGIPLQMADILGPAAGPPGLPNGAPTDAPSDAAAAAAGAAAAAAVAGVRPLRQQDIARDIGQQVEAMILQAKHASESRVSKEVAKINQKMEQMGAKIKMITERMNTHDVSANQTGGSVMKADLSRSVAKLEDVWDSEVATLKHELWQTIQAHNHNSDLLKHHKDAIDVIQNRMTEQASNPELEHIHRELMQVNTIMQREQAKQQQLDQLMQRLTAVQQQLMHGATVPPPSAMGMGPWGAGLLPPGPMPGGPGAPPVQAVGKKASAPRKQAKAKGQGQGPGAGGRGQGVPGAGVNHPPSTSLRPDAPEFIGFRAAAAEFVPMGVPGGQDGA